MLSAIQARASQSLCSMGSRAHCASGRCALARTVMAVLLYQVVVASAKRIVPGLYGNLSNQRWVIMNTLIAARQWNATAIIPPCKVSDDQATGTLEQITEAATLWDLAHLHRTAAAHGLRVSTPTPEEYTDMCPEFLPTEAMPEKLKAFKEGDIQIMCINPIYAFYELWKEALSEMPIMVREIVQGVRFLEYHKWYLDSAHFHWARTFLRPAPAVHHRAERAASEIKALFGVEYFFALHHRQGDFVGACAQWQDTYAIDGLKCLITADDALHMLRDVFQVPAQTVLLTVPPHPLDSLGQLCTHYRCTHRELLPGYLEATEGLPPMVIAQHQFALAVLAARAFGNIYSSWSIEMLAYMRSAGKPADIINPFVC